MAETARADEQQQAAAAPESRLADLRALRKLNQFDPFEVIIDELRKDKGRDRLSPKDRVQAAEGLARLELEYEKFEWAKQNPQRGLKGSITATGPGGQMTLDFGDDGKTVDELRDELRREGEALGISISFAKAGDAGKPE